MLSPVEASPTRGAKAPKGWTARRYRCTLRVEQVSFCRHIALQYGTAVVAFRWIFSPEIGVNSRLSCANRSNDAPTLILTPVALWPNVRLECHHAYMHVALVMYIDSINQGLKQCCRRSGISRKAGAFSALRVKIWFKYVSISLGDTYIFNGDVEQGRTNLYSTLATHTLETYTLRYGTVLEKLV